MNAWIDPPVVGQEVWVVVRQVSGGETRYYPESRHVVSADSQIACLLLRASLCDRLEFWSLGDVYRSLESAKDGCREVGAVKIDSPPGD
jgi:hypothetical protein